MAVELFFANAGHYLKMDNLLEANRIYDEFAQRYQMGFAIDINKSQVYIIRIILL